MAENTANPRVWWQIVNNISGKGGHSDIPTLLHNGISYETALEKAEILKDIFVSKSTIDNSGKVPILLSNYADKPLNSVKIRKKIIESKLKHLKMSKATGPDGIPARILRECAHSLAKPLSGLFYLSLSVGVVPHDWKCANVVPIYKSDGKSNPCNYRPISLLSIISKVMESIVNDRLCKHIFDLNLKPVINLGFIQIILLLIC